MIDLDGENIYCCGQEDAVAVLAGSLDDGVGGGSLASVKPRSCR